MRIVFGWNSFKIKSFSPIELGLPATIGNGICIEFRQRYFHLFYIPFLPIGKKWTIRKNGTLYEMPAIYEIHIRKNHTPLPTPWYTYAGPLLIAAGCLVYGATERVNDFQADLRRENDHEARVATLSGQLAGIGRNDYCWLHEIGASGSTLLLKVDSVKGSNVGFSMLTTGLRDYELSPRKVQYLFTIRGAAVDKITIDRQKMRLALPPAKYREKEKGVDVLGDGRLFVIGAVYHYDGPMIVDLTSGYVSKEFIEIRLINQGWPGTLTKITNLAGSYQWTNHLPQPIGSAMREFDPAGEFQLTGTNNTSDRKYKVELTMIDSLQKEHRYLIEGVGFKRKVRQEY